MKHDYGVSATPRGVRELKRIVDELCMISCQLLLLRLEGAWNFFLSTFMSDELFSLDAQVRTSRERTATVIKICNFKFAFVVFYFFDMMKNLIEFFPSTESFFLFR